MAIPSERSFFGFDLLSEKMRRRLGFLLVLVLLLSGMALAQTSPRIEPTPKIDTDVKIETEATPLQAPEVDVPPQEEPKAEATPPQEPKTESTPQEDLEAESLPDGLTEAEVEAADGPEGWERRMKSDQRRGKLTIDNLPHVPPDLDKWNHLPWKNLYFRPTGFIEIDLIGDTAPIKNQFSFTPSQIPFNDDYTVQNSGFISLGPSVRLSGRRTRFATEFYSPLPKLVQGTRVSFEMDFMGVDASPNLRHLYVAWKHLIVGRADSVFTDLDAEPESVDPSGPNARLGTRQNGIRLVAPFKNYNFAVSLEDSGGIVTPTGIKLTDDGLRSRPDYGFHIRTNRDWGHLQLSGMLRDLETEGFSSESSTFTGYGLGLSGRVFNGALDNYQFEFSAGNGLGRMVTDLVGTNSELGVNAQGVLGTQKSWSGFVSYQHWWSEQSRSTLYLSYVNVLLRDGQPLNSYQSGTQIGLNYFRSQSKKFTWGVEGVYGSRENYSGDSRSAGRIQGMVRYRF